MIVLSLTEQRYKFLLTCLAFLSISVLDIKTWLTSTYMSPCYIQTFYFEVKNNVK